ncbi:xyloglucan:xyloglucosyl transferase [Marchantia polymorpha subsp. ruderalis]|uniref:Xyloglucan endotransglucosylase/hydrolase n=2 Tax=Marchantia polymorpha TaxID=3197 RepID=A0A176W6Z6_MARPO|nr:hypothetical protein AXG93_684s1050 [Marchantia polymorpha subsp. ruderalis]PTQ30095.1 hypothetical protein MARPO_0130s0045 [Marchantia polymorpha]BBN00818.1 hypothetical protein Mp_2g02380 [Marchantia polymorpha subsp. ruderalis]|eukprot:PTQ30095.1 hypothetical protein MARPO_0130s0045 [Marchantia polymorpha]
MGSQALIAGLIFALFATTCSAQVNDQRGFYERFQINWAGENIWDNAWAKEVQMQLVPTGGASIASYNSYLYGHFSARLKLVANESSGVVTALYLTSYGPNWDEIDFEFLGNETGQPYVLHTNLFVNGNGSREQRIFLWFDPTLDFHTYAVVWNHEQILWLVDDIPIRVHKNREAWHPNSFPHFRPMVVAASIFEASTWATQGGRVPIKWEFAPFKITFSNFTFDACTVWNNDTTPCNTEYWNNPWESWNYTNLDWAQAGQLNWVKNSFTVYDYCTDRVRFPVEPAECVYNAV